MFTIAIPRSSNLPIAKRLAVDGTRITADKTVWPSDFRFRRVDADQLESASDIYRFLCRIAERGEALIATSLKDDAPTFGERVGKNFECVGANVYICEIDGLPFLDGYDREDLIRDPEGVLDKHIRHYHQLPERYSYVAVLSSSAGFSKEDEEIGLRYHLYLAGPRYQPHEIDYLDELHERSFASLGKGVFDRSIRRPGQFLLVAPPIFENGIDPFPKRIFYRKGVMDSVAFQFPPEFEKFERVQTMAMRGQSHSMPRLNKDAFDSESYRSEAVQKWVAAMRWRDRNMTWNDAYPLLCAELERVEASPDAWRRLGGLDLKEAKRMWNQFAFRGKQRSAFAEPRYREPTGSVDAAYRKMKEALDQQLKQPGVYLNKVSLGVGKSQQMIERATHEERNTIIMAPSIERCEELQERLNAEEEKRRAFDKWDWDDPDLDPDGDVGLPFVVWRGRQQPGMCERADLAKEVHAMGGSVHRDLCGHGQDVKCPHFATCPHAAQYDAIGHVRWLMPSQSITERRRIGNEAEVVFIDEGVADTLAGQTSFKLVDLLTPREPRLDELSLKAHTALAAGDTALMAASDFGLTRAEIEEACELELSLRPTLQIVPSMSDDSIRDELKAANGAWYPALYAFWKQLLAEYELAEAEPDRDYVNSIHKYWARDIKEHRVRVAWQVEPKLLNDSQVIAFFDATPNVPALRAHFPNIEVVEFDAPNQNVHVAQVLNMSGRKNQFIAMNDKPKEIERARSARANLAKWLRAQPGYMVCILPKAVRELLENEHRFERVAFGHYGAVQGQDEWRFPNGVVKKGAEIDSLALFGRSAPPAWEPEAIAMGHFWKGEKIERVPVPENGIPWYDQREKAVADGYAGYVLRHPDERVDAVLRGIWHSTQLQAFGRGRATRRDRPLRVFIGHYLALDVEVAEALEERELHARCGDAILLSPAEVKRVFGYDSGDFVRRIERKPNVKYWVRAGQTQPFRAWVREGVDDEAVMADLGALRWEREA